MPSCRNPQHRHAVDAATILIIDDNLASQEAAAEVLRERGYVVYTAGGVRAMERTCGTLPEPPRLALIEFRLREGGGQDAAARLRARWPSVFVMYFSCVDPEHDAVLARALDTPATALIFKPTSLDAIVEAVELRIGPATAAESGSSTTS